MSTQCLCDMGKVCWFEGWVRPCVCPWILPTCIATHPRHYKQACNYLENMSWSCLQFTQIPRELLGCLEATRTLDPRSTHPGLALWAREAYGRQEVRSESKQFSSSQGEVQGPLWKIWKLQATVHSKRRGPKLSHSLND